MQRHTTTNFYNLCLHPVNEVRERHAADLVPRGSLLVWIDDMYSNPHTPIDRTLGRWENVAPASYIIPREIRPRVHLKGFACCLTDAPADLPQMHGDFSRLAYWDDDTWKPDPPAVATLNNEPVRQKANEIRVKQQSRRPSTRPRD